MKNWMKTAGGYHKYEGFGYQLRGSSLKYQLIDSDSEEVLAKVYVKAIGIDGNIAHQPAGVIR